MPSCSASTRISRPSSDAGAIIIRASCPPPITPTRLVMPLFCQLSAVGAHVGVGRRLLRLSVRQDLADLDLVAQRLAHETRRVHALQRQLDAARAEDQRAAAEEPLDGP